MPDPDAFWVSMLTEMGSLTTPEELISWVYSRAPKLPRIEGNLTNVRLDTDVRDGRAMRIVPKDVLVRNPFPIVTHGDGRCFLFSASRLAFGYADNIRVAELRIRIIIDGFINKHEYISHSFLARGMSGPDLMSSLPETLAELSGYYDEQNTMKDVALIYNNMLWNYRRPYEVCFALHNIRRLRYLRHV